MANLSHPYAQLLGDRDPIAVLAETQQSIPAIARELGPEGLKRTYAPGKWTASQILAHLADCEIAFGFRVRQIVAEPALGVQSFDENQWAERYDCMDGLQATEVFQSLRGWNLSLFRLLSVDELKRSAAHPKFGQQEAGTVVRIMAGHTLNHLAQLEKIALTSR
jgi:DinB superfamily